MVAGEFTTLALVDCESREPFRTAQAGHHHRFDDRVDLFLRKLGKLSGGQLGVFDQLVKVGFSGSAERFWRLTKTHLPNPPLVRLRQLQPKL